MILHALLIHNADRKANGLERHFGPFQWKIVEKDFYQLTFMVVIKVEFIFSSAIKTTG